MSFHITLQYHRWSLAGSRVAPARGAGGSGAGQRESLSLISILFALCQYLKGKKVR
jgi:hypothetical protein